MDRRRALTLLALALTLVVLTACAGGKATPTPQVSGPSLGPVALNPHPASLEGKTVVLRWNGKPNGDKFLTRVGELLAEQVPGVKVVKMWEVDPSTAVISDGLENSTRIAEKIAAQKPDLVIAAQCD